jgi:hypothetical protein
MSTGIEDDLKPLSNNGLDVLTAFITHQDTTTWAALSASFAGEFALLLMWVQLLLSGRGYPTLGVIGLILTVVSIVAFWRSTGYLEAYYGLAKKRCVPADLEIFDVKVAGPNLSIAVLALQVFLFIFWVAVIFYVSS